MIGRGITPASLSKVWRARSQLMSEMSLGHSQSSKIVESASKMSFAFSDCENDDGQNAPISLRVEIAWFRMTSFKSKQYNKRNITKDDLESNQAALSPSTRDWALPIARWCLHLFIASTINLTHRMAELDLSKSCDEQNNCCRQHTFESKCEAGLTCSFKMFDRSVSQIKHSEKVSSNRGCISNPNAAHAILFISKNF